MNAPIREGTEAQQARAFLEAYAPGVIRLLSLKHDGEKLDRELARYAKHIVSAMRTIYPALF